MTKLVELGKEVGLEAGYEGSSNNNRWWKLKTLEELIHFKLNLVMFGWE